MQGTLICGVTDTDDGRSALELSLELSERLALRLVLVNIADGIETTSGNGDDGYESVSMLNDRVGAARLLARLADEYSISDTAVRREAVGDPATLLGRIAAEEAGDLIVLGSRVRGRRFRRGLESRLAEELRPATTIPVVIAPPRQRGPRVVARSA